LRQPQGPIALYDGKADSLEPRAFALVDGDAPIERPIAAQTAARAHLMRVVNA
jgi:hypothetical protein